LFAGAGWCTARRPSFVTRIHAYAYAGGMRSPELIQQERIFWLL
jgi:hypothetical protein